MKTDKFPKGWDEKRVRGVLEHYEAQTEDEAVAEDEAAYKNRTQTTIETPRGSFPTVRDRRGMNPVWSQGPRELLEHAYDHVSKGEGFDCRIAFISVDNAVEVMAKAYLSFNDKQRRVESSGAGESKIDKSTNFPKLLELLQKAASDRIVGLNVEEILHFHSIRNLLYHTFGLSVERPVVEAYVQIAKALYENLFESSLRIAGQTKKMGDAAKFISRWNALQEMLAAKLPARTKHDQNAFVEFFAQISPELANRYEQVRRFRNTLVHGQLAGTQEDIRGQLEKIERLLEAGESEERASKPSGKKSWSTQLNLDELRDQAKRFLEEKLQQHVKQLKLSLFETEDGGTGIRYSISRAYPTGKQTQFWFALHGPQIEFLNSHAQAFVAFVCVGAGVLYAPWNEFQVYVDDLGETSTDTGHWRHVILRRTGEGAIQMKLRGSGPESKIDVSRWFVKRWPLAG